MFTRTLLHCRQVGDWIKDAPRMDHPSTIVANENIEAVERIVMHDLFLA